MKKVPVCGGVFKVDVVDVGGCCAVITMTVTVALYAPSNTEAVSSKEGGWWPKTKPAVLR